MQCSGSPQILCIEDDRECAALIADELGERGFEAVIAYDGHEGLVTIIEMVPDLVVRDISLPIMDGFELLERLNELAPRLGHIPFVFLDRTYRPRYRAAGAAARGG